MIIFVHSFVLFFVSVSFCFLKIAKNNKRVVSVRARTFVGGVNIQMVQQHVPLHKNVLKLGIVKTVHVISFYIIFFEFEFEFVIVVIIVVENSFFEAIEYSNI
jgi:hypothetical protein